jgi:hypothetical protein
VPARNQGDGVSFLEAQRTLELGVSLRRVRDFLRRPSRLRFRRERVLRLLQLF